MDFRYSKMTFAIKKRKRGDRGGKKRRFRSISRLAQLLKAKDYASNLLIGKHSSCYLSFSGFLAYITFSFLAVHFNRATCMKPVRFVWRSKTLILATSINAPRKLCQIYRRPHLHGRIMRDEVAIKGCSKASPTYESYEDGTVKVFFFLF